MVCPKKQVRIDAGEFLCILEPQLRWVYSINPIALRKAKIVSNFGLSECNNRDISGPE